MKLAPLVAMGSVLVGLTACGSGSGGEANEVTPPTTTVTATVTDPETSMTPSEAPTPSAAPTPAPKNQGPALTVLRQNAPRFKQVDDATIMTFARNTCKGLDSGLAMPEVSRDFTNSGMHPFEARTIIMFSVFVVCPEYTEELNSWVDDL